MKILRLQTGKRAESHTDRKNAQRVMINITIVKFPVISGYGTYVIHLAHRFFLQYIVPNE